MSTFQKLEALRPYSLADGVAARAVHGERLTLAVVDLAPNAVVAEHQHENEQLGFVIRGSITMRIGKEMLELQAGDKHGSRRHSTPTVKFPTSTNTFGLWTEREIEDHLGRAAVELLRQLEERLPRPGLSVGRTPDRHI